MARSLCPASCRFFILLVSLGGLTTGFTGCGGVSGDPPPVSPPNHPKDACAVATVQGNVSQQFLIGSDALGSLFAYKLDQETGVLTAMPWSPMQLDGSLGSETTDATGDYLYVAMQITPTYHALETFRFPRDGSAPVRLDSRLAPEGVIAFDPQHRYLYVLNEANITNSPDPADNASLSVFRIDSSHLPHDTDQTVMLPERADAFGFKDQGRAVVVSRQRRTYGNTSIAVLKRDCKTGGLTPASETPIPRSQWLSVPLVGNGMIAYRLCCDPNAPSGSQLSSYDPSSHSVAAVSNGTLLDTYTAAIDRLQDFPIRNRPIYLKTKKQSTGKQPLALEL